MADRVFKDWDTELNDVNITIEECALACIYNSTTPCTAFVLQQKSRCPLLKTEDKANFIDHQVGNVCYLLIHDQIPTLFFFNGMNILK